MGRVLEFSVRPFAIKAGDPRLSPSLVALSRASAFARISAEPYINRRGQKNFGALTGSYFSKWTVRRVAGLLYFNLVSPKTSRHSPASPGSYLINWARKWTWLWSWSLTRLLSNHDCTPSAKYS